VKSEKRKEKKRDLVPVRRVRVITSPVTFTGEEAGRLAVGR
jgi:hypothetical protein